MAMTEKQRKQDQLAREILTLARNTLLVNLRFLDAALSQFQWEPIETGTLMTDGKYILYNPNHVLSSYQCAKEIPVRDYLHIVLHCVFRHMYMSPTLNRSYWDLACDIAVENIIGELGLPSATAPREQQQSEVIFAVRHDLKHVTAEKIYSYLRLTVPDPVRITELHSLFCADNHELWYMTAEKAETVFNPSDNNGDDDPKSNDDNSSEVVNGNNGNHIADRNGCSRTEMAEVWQDISQRMQMELEAFDRKQGMNSGAMAQNLTAVNREKYDYTAFLKKFAVMGEAMKINDDEFDYIFYTYGLQLYENMPLIEPLEYKEVKAIKEFVVAIDTSGSTSGELVQRFVQKTYNILKSTESFFTKINLHIIQCDANIQEDRRITSQEEFDEYLQTMKIHGLGGTDFRPVFEYVDRLRCQKEFNNLKGLIYFTDGYGTYPAQKPDYETAFVFLDDDYGTPCVPSWAIKLVLQKNEI